MPHNHCQGCEIFDIMVARAKEAFLSVRPRTDIKALVGECSRPEPESLLEPSNGCRRGECMTNSRIYLLCHWLAGSYQCSDRKGTPTLMRRQVVIHIYG